MLDTCSLVRIGLLQKEHGCRPSNAHMILPQLRQLGAVVNNGWIEALHGHFRRSVDREGLVESSNAAIAVVRSLMLEVEVLTILY